LLSLVSTGISLLVPIPLAILVDNVIGHRAPPSYLAALPGSGGRTSLLVWVVVGGLAIFALTSVVESVLTWLWIRVGQSMVFEVSADTFSSLVRRSLLFHRTTPVGDSMARVTGDSWAVHTIAEALVYLPLQAVVTMTVVLVVMFQFNAPLALVSAAVAPLMVAGSAVLGRRMRDVSWRRRETESGIQSLVQQTMSGISVVQAFGQEEGHRRRFADLAGADIHLQKRSTLFTGLNSLGAGLATTVGTALVMWFGAHQVLRHQLSVGELLIFFAYLAILQDQLKQLGGTYATLQTGHATIGRVLEVLDADPEVYDQPGAPVLPPVRGDITFDEVGFSYEPGRPVLDGVRVEVSAGETVALVGATGAGKSTLVGLVPRFFDPTSGRVLIDGHDLRHVQLASVRRQVSVVLQESFLFPMSIADNIAYGRPGAGRSDIEAAGRAANVDEIVDRLPEGYATAVGERGATLSGGERQRVAIARALIRNAPILILDEPTSALDAATEHLVFEALERLMEGRTTLVIAHRLSTIRRADRILVLDGGRIIETGTHLELVAAGGAYARLCALQTGTPGTGELAGTTR
jgi:ATP-binding cassette subfamily B protein/subfamily B ATP-binding cassette protein MsbA